MPTAQRTELDISTLLDPRFKKYKFPGLPLALDLSDEKDEAMEALTGTWIHNWKPAAAAAPAAAAPAAAAPAEASVVNTITATAAAKMGASSSFFAMAHSTHNASASLALT